MSRGILKLERAVLESLNYCAKNIDQLEMDLSVERGTLLNILSYFIMEGVVRYKAGIYSLEQERCLEWFHQHDSPQGQIQEVVELVEASMAHKLQLTDSPVKSEFLFRKVWMDEEDRVAYAHLIQNLESFISYLEEKQKRDFLHKNNKLSKQEILLSLRYPYSAALTG